MIYDRFLIYDRYRLYKNKPVKIMGIFLEKFDIILYKIFYRR